MYSYHMIEWVLFLYIYCVLGWVWESSYVSVKSHQWVNRGFMHGPYLPIYGFGAIAVLLITIPIQEHLWMVFLFGMIGATVLEYFTGVAMESIFHVRYWDYSKQKFNLNGHICLTSSIAWGFFSIFMIKVLHCPIEAFVMWMPYTAKEIITLFATIVIASDFTQSFNEAMDLKELLENLTESNEEIRRLKKRLDVVIAVLGDEGKELVQKASDSKQMIGEKIVDVKQKVEQIYDEKTSSLSNLSERLNTSIETLKNSVTKESKEETEKLRTELESLKESILKQMAKFHNNSRTEKAYTRSLRMLRRNPDAVSAKYQEALEEVKELNKKK